MKTKIQIIEQLLSDGKITAQEAMTLMQTEKEYVYIPQWNDFRIPYYPYPPLAPFAPYSTTGDVILCTN